MSVCIHDLFSAVQPFCCYFSDFTLNYWVILISSVFKISAGPRLWSGKFQFLFWRLYLDELVQERHNSSVLAMVLRLSCTNPLICRSKQWWKYDKIAVFFSYLQPFTLAITTLKQFISTANSFPSIPLVSNQHGPHPTINECYMCNRAEFPRWPTGWSDAWNLPRSFVDRECSYTKVSRGINNIISMA